MIAKLLQPESLTAEVFIDLTLVHKLLFTIRSVVCITCAIMSTNDRLCCHPPFSTVQVLFFKFVVFCQVSQALASTFLTGFLGRWDVI